MNQVPSSEQTQAQYVTKGELETAISSAVHQINSANQQAIDTLKGEFRQQINQKVNDIERKINHETDNKIALMNDKLSGKIDTVLDKLNHSAQNWANIEGVLKTVEGMWKQTNNELGNHDKLIHDNEQSADLNTSKLASLHHDIHGDPERPKMPSVMGLLHEMNAFIREPLMNRVNDIGALATDISHRQDQADAEFLQFKAMIDERIAEFDKHIELESQRWRRRMARAQTKAKSLSGNMVSAATSRLGISMILGTALGIVMIFKPENAPALIEIIQLAMRGGK